MLSLSPEVVPGLRLEPLHGACLLAHDGLHDRQGQPIAASYLARGLGRDDFPFGAPQPLPAPSSFALHLQRPCLWVRFLVFWHFGHLLTETCGNIWPLLLPELRQALPADLLVLVPAAFESEIPQLIALTGRECVSTAALAHPVLLEQVWLPQPSTVDRGPMQPAHPRVMRSLLQLEQQRRAPGGWPPSRPALADECSAVQPAGLASSLAKVYVSRSRLPASFRHLQQEEQLEALLLDHGWTILHPELLPLADQVDLLCSARVLAGCSGSAFHLLMARSAIRCSRLLLLTLDYGLELNFRHQFQLQGLAVQALPYLRYCGDKEGSSRDLQSSLAIEALAATLEAEALQPLADAAYWQGPVIDS